MNTHLTVKQNNFCQNYVLTGNASEAYRLSYDAENMKTETIHRKSTELMQHGLVSARIQELQKDVQATYEITLDSQISKYNQLFEAAGTDIQEPRQRIDSKIRILSRLDKICGLESPVADKPGNRDIIIVLDEKDMRA